MYILRIARPRFLNILRTIAGLNLHRPIEELSSHIVMSEPRVRDPNSGLRVGFQWHKNQQQHHHQNYQHNYDHWRCGLPSHGSLTKRTQEASVMSSRALARWPIWTTLYDLRLIIHINRWPTIITWTQICSDVQKAYILALFVSKN